MSSMIIAPLELQKASYNIYRYTDQIYKIVHFKSTAPRLCVSPEKHSHYDKKLDASISRAKRVVLELALCNDWAYFCTFTLDPTKFDRYNLDAWYKSFSQFIRDQRKKHGVDIAFLLVPELHPTSGAWHMHGLFSDVSPMLVSFADMLAAGHNVPVGLAKSGYMNWPDYQQKFGFCSFGKIKNKVACSFYVTKYISKSISDTTLSVGKHLYYASRSLNRATFHGDVYGECGYLDKFLTNHYDFCDTGMTAVKDNCTWSFGMEYMDYEMLTAFSFDEEDTSAVSYYEAVQEVIAGF